jgi:SAM-dependent methyltransferase
MSSHAGTEPSDWVRRWLHLVRPGGTVLDVACGSGRHLRWLAAQGFQLTGIDRDAQALQPLHALGEIVCADIEAGPWPLPQRSFDAVLITHYLWRPLWPMLRASLADGGVLIHETFADGQQTVGRPARPEFLLGHGELLQACAGLRIVAYEDGFVHTPERYVQRVVAVQLPANAAAAHPRFGLQAPS